MTDNESLLHPTPSFIPPFTLDPDTDAAKRDAATAAPLTLTPARKLCVRHQRMADSDSSLKMQHSLDALPLKDREAVNMIWSGFSSSSHPRRALILQGLLTMCCFSQLSLLTEQLKNLIRLDPFHLFPREVSLKVLQCLDAISLGRAAQVSRHWRSLADDNILWKNICEQHIDKKCRKCGWGLPLLEKRRPFSSSPSPSFPPSGIKRDRDHDSPAHPSDSRPFKRQKSEQPFHSNPESPPPAFSFSSSSSSASAHDADINAPHSPSPPPAITRPWKEVYCERLTVERNWRNARYSVRTLKGHTDGVMCMQLSENLPHPSFPILITGSYDRTVRVWNLENGREVRCLTGHTRAVRALQFDQAKLITASMDRMLRVWDWRTGRCIRILEGHTEGVVALNFDEDVLASGSVDTTIKIWTFRNGGCFTLRGHRDWVNAVTLWTTPDAAPPPLDSHADAHACAGKMLFSASDDGSIRLWDLARRSCVRQFTGHVGQVQSIRLVTIDPNADENELLAPERDPDAPAPPATTDARPVLVSGSLDNTVKVWDIERGVAVKTLFGHIEGVWAIACDKLRLVSGSHDRTIKVWVREEGRCTATLVGHRGAVTCLALGDDKIVSGSDDGDVKVWSFAS